MSYTTVFLDWDGTLCRSKFWDHWAEGEGAAAYAKIQTEFFGANHAFLSRWMHGQETAETASKVIAELTGVSPEHALKELRRSCQNMKFVSARIPELVNKLRTQGTAVVVATDTMDTFERWVVPALGLPGLFDGILNSYDLGALKKEAAADGTSAFFGKYMLKHALGPGECALVDDNTKNAVVKDFGIDFIQVTPERGIIEIIESFLV